MLVVGTGVILTMLFWAVVLPVIANLQQQQQPPPSAIMTAERTNISSNVFAMWPNSSIPFGPFPPPVIVLNHTNTTETDRLPNGTIMTFDIQTPFEKAHGDICKLPMNLRPGIVCSPQDTKDFNPSLKKA